MFLRRRSSLLLLLACFACAAGTPAAAQSALDRTPNLSGGWVGAAGRLHFNFLHRFNNSGAPERQVTNRPTFLLAGSPVAALLVGAHYATRSDVVARMPNEWELFGRYLLASRERAPLDLSLQAGYNAAAASLDAELGAARELGRMRALGAVRYLSSAYGRDARWALAAGAVVRVGSALAVAADVASLLERSGDEELAWGVALQGSIPLTPHSFSLQAASTNSATLQGASRGAREVRWGFEFTVPITPARYFGGRARAMAESPAAAGADTVHADIRGLAYVPERLEVRPGTTIIWTNRDPVEHTVTAVDTAWDSGVIAPGAAWAHTFGEAGTHEFTCTPHPFMKGVVVVREGS